MKQLPFPRHLDDPQKLLFFSIDEVVIFSCAFMTGILLHMDVIGFLMGAGLSWLFSRYRDSRPDGFLLHMGYWYGVISVKGRVAINPFVRRIFPQ